MAERKPLHGVRYYRMSASEPRREIRSTRRGQQWLAVNRSYGVAERHAARLGAEIVDVPNAAAYRRLMEGLDTGEYIGLGNKWTIDGNYRQKVAEQFFDTPEGKTIARPVTKSYIDCDPKELQDQLIAGIPFILADQSANRGHLKYLIEQPFQLARFQQFCADHPKGGWAKRFSVREFIETPSDRYLHVREVVTATGELLASGIVYSAHTKDSDRIIINDRLDETFGPTLFMKKAFEDPDPANPYFLHSRDVRSNGSIHNWETNRFCIPLMGPGRDSRLNTVEEQILFALGIDPRNRQIPESWERDAVLIGKKSQPLPDILIGIDFVPSRVDGIFYELEWNTDPGGGVFARCWGIKDLDKAITEMRLKAVESLHPQGDDLQRYYDKCPKFDPANLEFQEHHGVQVARIGHGWIILKAPDGGLTQFSPKNWRIFIDSIKAGLFDIGDGNAKDLYTLFIDSCTPDEHKTHRDPKKRFT